MTKSAKTMWLAIGAVLMVSASGARAEELMKQYGVDPEDYDKVESTYLFLRARDFNCLAGEGDACQKLKIKAIEQVKDEATRNVRGRG